ncbi:MAG TPA: hypothetical protein VM925_26865, partial [Labilithrix sp.]|nr:hypothetical protein [Labilithrix sp.]
MSSMFLPPPARRSRTIVALAIASALLSTGCRELARRLARGDAGVGTEVEPSPSPAPALTTTTATSTSTGTVTVPAT